MPHEHRWTNPLKSVIKSNPSIYISMRQWELSHKCYLVQLLKKSAGVQLTTLVEYRKKIM